ncbi:MAG TPA: hypothetical protein VM734_07845 [Kofleriaceae bacterium]|nr:hypothetical protein [Kofleriaceae bacterium]
MRSSTCFGIALSFATVLAAAAPARAECECVAIAGDVAASIQAQVARADGLYARGDLRGALALYAAAWASTPDPSLLFAQGMVHVRLGEAAAARARLEAYLASGGELAFAARARAALARLDRDGGVVAAVGGGAVGTVGAVGGLGAGLVGGVAGVGGAAVGELGGVGGEVVGGVGGLGDVDRPRPKKLAKGAAIVLGVVAVGAIGAVAIQGITAGIKDDVELDGRFGLGMGLSGAVVGGTAIYLWGLTAAAGATAATVPCVTQRALVAPVAYRGGGGVAAAVRF